MGTVEDVMQGPVEETVNTVGVVEVTTGVVKVTSPSETNKYSGINKRRER